MNSIRYFMFVAQSLDNRSPDIISVQGSFLPSDDLRSPERIDLIDDTTYISSRGKEVKVRDSSSCRAFVLDEEVVIEITPGDRDASGRASPILCLGRLDRPDASVWGDVALGELDEFAGRIGRSIDARQASDFAQLVERVLPSQRFPRPIAAVVNALKGAPRHFSVGGATQELNPEARHKEPQTKKVAVLVLDNADRRYLASRPKAAVLLHDPNVTVLDLPAEETGPDSDLISHLDELGLMQSPNLLFRDPYDPARYFRAEDLAIELAKSKHRAYQKLCQLLGAKAVVVESVSKQERSAERTTNVTGAVEIQPGVKVSGGASSEASLRQDLADHFRLEQKYSGSPANLPAAEEFLRSRGLLWDGDLSHLLDVARDQGNPPKELSLSFSTKEAVDRLSKKVGHLETAIAELSADRKTAERYHAIYRFNVSVSF